MHTNTTASQTIIMWRFAFYASQRIFVQVIILLALVMAGQKTHILYTTTSLIVNDPSWKSQPNCWLFLRFLSKSWKRLFKFMRSYGSTRPAILLSTHIGAKPPLTSPAWLSWASGHCIRPWHPPPLPLPHPPPLRFRSKSPRRCLELQ